MWGLFVCFITFKTKTRFIEKSIRKLSCSLVSWSSSLGLKMSVWMQSMIRQRRERSPEAMRIKTLSRPNYKLMPLRASTRTRSMFFQLEWSWFTWRPPSTFIRLTLKVNGTAIMDCKTMKASLRINQRSKSWFSNVCKKIKTTEKVVSNFAHLLRKISKAMSEMTATEMLP